MKKETCRPLCITPFININLQPDGHVGSCRLKGSDFTFGNLRNQSLKEIWSSAPFQKWRTDFLKGEKGYCKQEIEHMNCHLCPETNDITLFDNSFDVASPPILKLSANFNGKCNLKCQMCHIHLEPNGFYDTIPFWEEARTELFPFLQEIDMLSGEPFIQKDTFRLIDEVSGINPKCLWSFTTNAHWRFSPYIKKYLDKINIKNLIVSIDGTTQKTYTKIRPPGRIDLTLKCLSDLVQYKNERNDFTLWWNFLFQKDNWFEVAEAIRMADTMNVKSHPIFLYEPSEYSVLTLPYEERLHILLFVIDHVDISSHLGIFRILRPLLESMRSEDKKLAWGKILLKTESKTSLNERDA